MLEKNYKKSFCDIWSCFDFSCLTLQNKITKNVQPTYFEVPVIFLMPLKYQKKIILEMWFAKQWKYKFFESSII